MLEQRLPLHRPRQVVVLDVERVEPIVEVLEVLHRDVRDGLHALRVVLEDDDEVEVLERHALPDTLEDDEVDVLDGEDEERRLGERDDAARRRVQLDTRALGDAEEAEVAVRSVEGDGRRLLHHLAEVVELLVQALLALARALLLLDLLLLVLRRAAVDVGGELRDLGEELHVHGLLLADDDGLLEPEVDQDDELLLRLLEEREADVLVDDVELLPLVGHEPEAVGVRLDRPRTASAGERRVDEDVVEPRVPSALDAQRLLGEELVVLRPHGVADPDALDDLLQLHLELRADYRARNEVHELADRGGELGVAVPRLLAALRLVKVDAQAVLVLGDVLDARDLERHEHAVDGAEQDLLRGVDVQLVRLHLARIGRDRLVRRALLRLGLHLARGDVARRAVEQVRVEPLAQQLLVLVAVVDGAGRAVAEAGLLDGALVQVLRLLPHDLLVVFLPEVVRHLLEQLGRGGELDRAALLDHDRVGDEERDVALLRVLLRLLDVVSDAEREEERHPLPDFGAVARADGEARVVRREPAAEAELLRAERHEHGVLLLDELQAALVDRADHGARDEQRRQMLRELDHEAVGVLLRLCGVDEIRACDRSGVIAARGRHGTLDDVAGDVVVVRHVGDGRETALRPTRDARHGDAFDVVLLQLRLD